MGTADFAVPTLRALAEAGEEIAAVFTRPDRPAGRGRRLRPPPVKQAAEATGLRVYQPQRVSAGEGLRLLRSVAPDLVVVVAFGEILGEAALSTPRLGAINTHASLLPRYRGAAPIQRALLAGERATGVTVQWMSADMDAGDILLQREVAIADEEDFGSLHDRLAALGAEATVESVALIRRGMAPRVPQDHEQATCAPAIQRQDLLVDWTRPAEEVARLVRAFSPGPGARTTRDGDILKVLAAQAGKNAARSGGIPGEIMELTCEGFWVATGDGRVLVTCVQPAGRKAMSAADYLKGHRLPEGERLGL
jgi:methionyl-tRNA formyltransferase